MPAIDRIENDLLRHAENASVEDLSKIAEALKAVAETKTSELSLLNNGREIRLEFFKSVAAFLVPLVSLLALFGTIIFQNKQLEATRQRIEDTEWRDLLTSLKGISESASSDPTVAPRLRSFFDSATYGVQAKAIAGRLMGHISSPDGFHELFSAVFGEINSQNIASILDMDRNLFSSEHSLESQCNEYLSSQSVSYDTSLADCGIYMSESQFLDLSNRLKVPTQVSVMHRSIIQLFRENTDLDARLADFIRTKYAVKIDRKDKPGLDFSSVSISLADYSDTDLTGFNISGALFDTVDFKGAIINPKNQIQMGQRNNNQPDFRGSTWWEASYIEPTLLQFLQENYYPYMNANIRYPEKYYISKDEYSRKIASLCRGANVSCPTEPKFGTPPEPPPTSAAN